MAASINLRSNRPYNPPQHLLTHWTAAYLQMQFQAFRDDLDYAQDSPELVFERLIGSLNHGFEITANQQPSLVDQLRAEKQELQDSVTQLRAELAESQANRQLEPISRPSSVPPASVVDSSVDSRPSSPAPEPAGARLVCKFIGTAKKVLVRCKSSTAACPIELGGCTWADTGHSDPTFQSGQITFSGNPAGVMQQVVNFDTRFQGDTGVLVWLTHIDYRGKFSVEAESQGISTAGFLLNITIGASCNAQEVGVAWVAYPAGRDEIQSGTGGIRCLWTERGIRLFNLRGNNPHIRSVLFGRPKIFVVISSVQGGDCEQVVVETSGELISASVDELNLRWGITDIPQEAMVYDVGVSWLVIG